jgi:hypothetical protein
VRVHTDRWLDVLFGKGDDDFPFWLMAVRVNVLLFVLCGAIVVGWNLTPTRIRRALAAKTEIATVLALTAVAAALRFLVASPNLMDFGGIPYSRLLLGYRGHFATAQFYSLFYELTARDIEHAILLDRIAGTLTIPLVHVLCRQLQPGARLFPALAALLFAVYPLHVMFSASDALPAFSLFLTAAAYVLLAGAEGEQRTIRTVRYLGGFAGLALLTQVRYENVLFLVPAALFFLARRGSLRLRELLPALVVGSVFVAFYACEARTAGLSFQNPVDLQSATRMLVERLLSNPLLALPSLLVGTAAVAAYRGAALGMLVLLPWPVAFALALLTNSGHGAARVYCAWLILILPAAAYGFSLLLASPRRVAKAIAAVALLPLVAQPVIARDRLTARHLEMWENDFFRAVLSALPADVKRIVVPDDELLRRRSHSFNEVYIKYAMIHAGMPEVAKRTRLVGVTSFLEERQERSCAEDACVFFFGLPCLEQRVYPYTREQCRAVLEAHRSSVVRETTVVAAPFLDCAIYTGRLWDELCAPVTGAQRFVAYRLED